MFIKNIVVATIVAILLLLAGCHILGGGGWLPGLNGGKAHFGFSAECYEEFDPDIQENIYLFHRGDFQYMDKSAGVRFHGEIEASFGIFGFEGGCDELVAAIGTPEELATAQFSGTCRSQPKKHEGVFTVYVEDNGKPGMTGDYIEITTEGCGADGGDYFHSGTLGGGNIWFEDHPDAPE